MAAGKEQIIKTHQELHHYTTLDGLTGILAGHEMWATQWDCLNDRSEIEHFREYAIKEFVQRIKATALEEQRASLKARRTIEKAGGLLQYAEQQAKHFIDAIYRVSFETSTLGIPMATPYIVSFCGHRKNAYVAQNGLLSQWRAYGGDQRYAIVFDTEKLCDLISSEHERYRYSFMSISDVVYNDDQINFSEQYKYVFDLMTDAWAHAKKRAEHPEFGTLFMEMMSATTRFKHRGFAEEQEVRIVAAPLDLKLIDRLKSKGDVDPKLAKEPHRKGERRYIKLFEGMHALPIKRIIVGPGLNQDKRTRDAMKLAKNEIEVVSSDTPYVG